MVITLELEAAPRVRCSYLTDGGEARMLLWLEGRPELLELIRRAIELESETRAA